MSPPDEKKGGGSGKETAPQAETSENLSPPRYAVKTHQGWFAVPEEELRKIAKSFDEPAAYRAALLAYITVCRKANLKGADSFEDRIASMAQDMGFPYRDAQRALANIEALGLIKIDRRKIPGTKANLPSVYTLLRSVITLGQEETTLGRLELRVQSPQHSQELSQEHPQERPSILSDHTGSDFTNGPSAVDAFRQARTEAGLLPTGGKA